MPYEVFSFPIDYDPGQCALVFIPISLIPFLAGALEPLEQRERWNTQADHQQAHAALSELGAELMSVCGKELIETQKAIYRLLDVSINGAVYTASGEPPVIVPEIPIVPLPLAPQLPLLQRLDRIEQYLDNAINGTTRDVVSDPRGIKQILDEILAKAGTDDDFKTELLQQLALILLEL